MSSLTSFVKAIKVIIHLGQNNIIVLNLVVTHFCVETNLPISQ